MQGGIKRVSSRRESKNQFDLFGNEEEKTGGDSDRRGWIKGKLEGGVDTRNTSSLSLSLSPWMTKRSSPRDKRARSSSKALRRRALLCDYLVAGKREGIEGAYRDRGETRNRRRRRS